jgi:signal transduction histidine kinase
VTGLKGSPDEPVTFVAAVRRFARQFSAVTGIEVTVEGPGDLPLNDRLAGELFEMTAEAFSNIRRHTTALRTALRVEHAAGTIRLSITNETDGEAPAFSPRSVTERAESLGGTVRVHRAPGTTRLQIAIPL